jgi:hypothetical protein
LKQYGDGCRREDPVEKKVKEKKDRPEEMVGVVEEKIV